MSEVSLLPAVNSELIGTADPLQLASEVQVMKDRLTAANDHLALERNLARQINVARNSAIENSPALLLVFTDERISAVDDIDAYMSSAFLSNVESNQLPDGFAKTVARKLRTEAHPDAGGDNDTAQDINQSLERIKYDPAFAVSGAVATAAGQSGSNTRQLLIDRYRLHLAIEGAKPHFESEEAAIQHAEVEINGAEWRVRQITALKSLHLITGGNEAWHAFVKSIVQTRHHHLIDMVNNIMPPLLTLQERLIKGEPIATEKLDITAIDEIFERVWTTLGKLEPGDDPLSYTPPYQHWLPILLPAMEMLDPGEKPGESYQTFEPPIQAVA